MVKDERLRRGAQVRAILDHRCARRKVRRHGNDAAEWLQMFCAVLLLEVTS
jgi:hypothetical protein